MEPHHVADDAAAQLLGAANQAAKGGLCVREEVPGGLRDVGDAGGERQLDLEKNVLKAKQKYLGRREVVNVHLHDAGEQAEVDVEYVLEAGAGKGTR